eukprot:166969_1
MGNRLFHTTTEIDKRSMRRKFRFITIVTFSLSSIVQETLNLLKFALLCRADEHEDDIRLQIKEQTLSTNHLELDDAVHNMIIYCIDANDLILVRHISLALSLSSFLSRH